MSIGNSFNSKSFSVGHARKVWRSVRSVYPGGGTVANVSDWKDKGVVPSGRPCKFDPKAKTVTVYTDAQVKAAVTKPETGEAPGIASLGINGHIEEDIRIVDGNTVGTATVVYAGEIYEYMLDSAVVTALKANTAVPQIVWVH